MEDLEKWRIWGNGRPGEMKDLGKGGSGEMEDLGKRRTSGTWRFKSFIIQEGKGCVMCTVH
jgi:hypothetical protein